MYKFAHLTFEISYLCSNNEYAILNIKKKYKWRSGELNSYITKNSFFKQINKEAYLCIAKINLTLKNVKQKTFLQFFFFSFLFCNNVKIL